MFCIWSSWCHCHSIISCSSKSQNGLPFWCRLTQVVLEKRLLNWCSVVVLAAVCLPPVEWILRNAFVKQGWETLDHRCLRTGADRRSLTSSPLRSPVVGEETTRAWPVLWVLLRALMLLVGWMEGHLACSKRAPFIPGGFHLEWLEEESQGGSQLIQVYLDDGR